MIKAYWLKELAELEGKAPITVKNSNRYIQIQIKSKRLKTRAKNGEQKRDYTIKYIRLEDIQKALKGKVDFNYLTTRLKW